MTNISGAIPKIEKRKISFAVKKKVKIRDRNDDSRSYDSDQLEHLPEDERFEMMEKIRKKKD